MVYFPLKAALLILMVTLSQVYGTIHESNLVSQATRSYNINILTSSSMYTGTTLPFDLSSVDASPEAF